MDRVKPVVLMATARSGSTPVSKAMGVYLRAYEGAVDLQEYFNVFYYDYRLVDGVLVRQEIPGIVRHQQATLFPEVRQKYLEKNFSVIKEYQKPYFFKFFPSQVNPEILDWIQSNFRVLCLKRKNTWEQFLSFMISSHTNLWYEEKGLTIPKRSILALESHVGRFFSHIAHYEKIKRTYQLKEEYYYEDYVLHGPHAMLKKMGYDRPVEIEAHEIPVKQNPNDKLTLFQNPTEIELWYKSAYSVFEQVGGKDV